MQDHSQKLPSEILGAILDYTSHADVMHASKISKSWRLAARRHYQFFHSLAFGFETEQPVYRYSFDRAFSKLRQIAEQEGPVRLRVTVLASMGTCQLHDAEHDALWNELVQLVAGVQPILQTLELRVHSTILCNRFFDALSVHDAPRLEFLTLSLHVRSDHSWMIQEYSDAARQVQDVGIPPTLFAASAPRLREVRVLQGVTLLLGAPVEAFSNITTLSIGLPPIGIVQLNEIMPKLRNLQLEPTWATRAVVIMPKSLDTLYIGPSNKPTQLDSIVTILSQTDLSRLRVVETFYTCTEGERLNATRLLTGLPDSLALRVEVNNRNQSAEGTLLKVYISGLAGHETSRNFSTLDEGNNADSLQPFASLATNLTTVHIDHPFVPHFLSMALEYPALTQLTIDVTSLGSGVLWPVSHELYGYVVSPCLPGAAYNEMTIRCPSLEDLVLLFVPDHPRIYQII